MSMHRVRCVWQNFAGAPGYTNFYTTISLTTVAPFVTFFDTIKSKLPLNLTVQIPGTGDVVNEATGQIQGIWAKVGGATITGTGAALYAGASGAVAEWTTQGIVAGRRVLGKSYLVPLINTVYDSLGTINTVDLAVLSGAANTLQNDLGSAFLVWSRPFEPDPDRVPPDTRPPRAGTSWHVIGSRVPDLAAVLKTRRK